MVINRNVDFKRLLRDFCLKNSDGFSIDFNLKPSKHKKGFFISITDNSHNDLNKAIDSLFKLRDSKFKHISNKMLYIGYWKDSKTNKNYLDLSIHIKNLKYALLIGLLFNQKAIFNISNFQEIRIK